MAREALIERNTKETQIRLQLNIDGTGSSDIDTGIGFFDHMLDGFTRHGLYDLTLRVHGDLNVDDHHTIEDTGIVLGNAIREAVGDKKGIKRYGSCILPMDEVLVLCAVDLSGRPYLGWDAEFSTEKIGDMATEMVKEFFYAVSYSAAMNLHIKVLSGGNSHHVAEAMFKSFAKALDAATQYDSRITDVLSTKGSLCYIKETTYEQTVDPMPLSSGRKGSNRIWTEKSFRRWKCRDTCKILRRQWSR